MSDFSNLYAAIANAQGSLGPLPGYGIAPGRVATAAPASLASLKSKPGFYYNATSKILVVSQDGANLANLDLRGLSVYVQANNVTIANCLFDASAGAVAVRGMDGYRGLTIDHCSFDGLKLDKTFTPVFAMGTNTTVSNSLFRNLQSDAISIAGGSIKGNLIAGSGYASGAHADAIAISGFKTNGPITIEDNLIDWRSAPDARVETNQAIRVTSDKGAIAGITITGNVLLGGSYTIGIEDSWGGAGSITGTSITGNVVDLGKFGNLYPQHPSALVYSGNMHVTGPVPAAGAESIGATVAQLTSGLGTLFGGSGNDALVGKAAAEFLSGRAGQDWISAGGGNDVIEGGAGRDYLTGGAGSDVFVYRSFETGAGDLIYDFVHGQDRLHLAELPGAPSDVSQWTWLGTERFTGNAWQIRQQTNDKGNTELQLDRDGNMAVDLTIEVTGRHSFTTADFLLATKTALSAGGDVPSQSVAAPTNGGQARASSSDNWLLIGSAFNDGLLGAGGNDTLVGGGGKDIVFGGAGHDRFVYESVSDSAASGTQRDYIGDFVSGEDIIDLSKIGVVAGTSAHDALSFIGSAAFSGRAGELRFTVNDRGGQVQVDVNGDKIIDLSIDVVSNQPLQATDFWL